MSTEIISQEQEIIDKFYDKVEKYYEDSKKEFIECENISTKKVLKKKYPYLKNIKAKTDINSIFKAFLIDILNFYKIDGEELKILIGYFCEKIQPIIKHAQALKTDICNLQISLKMTGQLSENNTMSICITKNTLEANEQWLFRLFKQLDSRFPETKLDNKIMIISSKKNDLNGNATHCKNVDKAISLLTIKNDYKIIFMCSNNIRLKDIYEISIRIKDNAKIRKNLHILHDEAHNTKDGIPPNRAIIENILLLPNVISYTPITATIGEIVDEKNPLWIKSNLEKTCINYLNLDEKYNIKSDSQNYSSISNYIQINIDEHSKDSEWKDYNIKEISRENFIKVTDEYKNKNFKELNEKEVEDILEDIDYRRQLEFTKFMENQKEIEALNNGLNILNNLESILQETIFIKNEFNLHIISTPCRKVVTFELCIEAIKQIYDPIVLGIYGNQGEKYHLFTKDIDNKCVDEIMGNGEFNCKLLELIKYLKSEGYNTEKPFIIIGNYIPTGESLSFVNYEYGIVRSVTKLISTTPEEDYQTACRGCFMTTKFTENDSNWICPPKYLIGSKNFIMNSIAYEDYNDDRIDALANENNNSTNNNLIISSQSTIVDNVNGRTSIPIKVNVDCSDKNYNKLLDIANKNRRFKDDKNEFMRLLKASCDDEESDFEIIDKTNKFNWEEMILNDFRCYKKDNVAKKGYWKFVNYNDNFTTNMPFINNTGNHTINQCEILVCKDKYIIKNDNGDIIETNPKNVWWIGYKY